MQLGHSYVMTIVYNTEDSRGATQAITQGTDQWFAATIDNKLPHHALQTQPPGNLSVVQIQTPLHSLLLPHR